MYHFHITWHAHQRGLSVSLAICMILPWKQRVSIFLKTYNWSICFNHVTNSLPYLYIDSTRLKDLVWNYLLAPAFWTKYNKCYKAEDEYVTKKNSFVYVGIKSTTKYMYTIDVWNVQSNIFIIHHFILLKCCMFATSTENHGQSFPYRTRL
jgi:hypothetical protein